MSRAYEGLKAESFDVLCAHVARLEPVSVSMLKKDWSEELLAALAVMVLGTVAFEGVSWLARRDVVRRVRRRVRRDVERRSAKLLRGVRSVARRAGRRARRDLEWIRRGTVRGYVVLESGALWWSRS